MSDEKDKVTEDSEESAPTSAPEETPDETPATEDAAAPSEPEVSESEEAEDTPAADDAGEKSEPEEEAAEASEPEEAAEASEPEPSEPSEASEPEETADDGGHGDDHAHGDDHGEDHDPSVAGVAAFFDHPDHLIYAASQARDAKYDAFDAFSPFPIHGMDDAMGLGRSWIPWVTFFAGLTGFSFATFMQFGVMWYDWPMVFGGRPFAAWPSFVPIMFELTVLFAGHTTAFVMLYAAGCFRKPLIIDPEITNDRFVLYISATDPQFNRDAVVEFMKDLNPMEVRTVRKEGHS